MIIMKHISIYLLGTRSSAKISFEIIFEGENENIINVSE